MNSAMIWVLLALIIVMVLIGVFILIYSIIKFKRRPAMLVLVLGPNKIISKRIEHGKEDYQIEDPIPPAGYKFDGWSTKPLGYTGASVPIMLPKLKRGKVLYARWINIHDNNEIIRLTAETEEAAELLQEKETVHELVVKALKNEEKKLEKQIVKEQKAITAFQKAVVVEEEAKQDLELKSQMAIEADRIKQEALEMQKAEREELVAIREEVGTKKEEASNLIAKAKTNLAEEGEKIKKEKEDLRSLIKDVKEQLAVQLEMEKRREEQAINNASQTDKVEDEIKHDKEAEIKGDSFND